MFLCYILIIISIFVPRVLASNQNYAFEIITYDAFFDIKSNHTIHIIEDIEVKYLGQYSTGFVRQIPVHSGNRAKNIDLKLKEKEKLLDYPYRVELKKNFDSKEYLYLYITDGVQKQNQSQVIRISYDYFITKPRNKNAIFLNVIGFGWDANINHANVLIQLPLGYKSSNFYIGKTTIPSNQNYYYDQLKRIITTSVKNLSKYNGLTFDLYFDQGALSTYIDLTPILIMIVCGSFLALILSLKALFSDKNKLNPSMNFKFSNFMDPLYIGKLLNEEICTNDVTSLVYYWSNKNFISITFIDEDDSLLTKLCQELPDMVPNYQKIMFKEIFINGDEIKVSSLDNKFYQTVQNVVDNVNQIEFNYIDGISTVISFLFTIVSALIMSLFPYFACKLNISSKLRYLDGFKIIISSIIIWIMELKSFHFNLIQKSQDKDVLETIIIISSAIVSIIYTNHIYNEIMELCSKILLCVLCHIIIFLSVKIIYPKSEFIMILDQVIGK